MAINLCDLCAFFVTSVLKIINMQNGFSIKYYQRHFICLSLIILLHQNILSQTVSSGSIIEGIETVSERTDGNTDFSTLTEELDALKDHPVNLNNTTFEQLMKIPYLKEQQAKNLVEYVQSTGPFLSVFELRAVKGLDSLSIVQILPFITISEGPKEHPLRIGNILRYGRHQLFIRYQQILEHQKGYRVDDSALAINPGAGYLGSQQCYYFRYTYSFYERIGIGLSGTKSPGEEFFKGTQPYGMDKYAFYISLQNTGLLRTLIIGNFQAEFGQGLTLSSGLSFGSLPGSGNSKRYGRGLRPTLSSGQASYLQGSAATINAGKFDLSGFYSNHRIDGNITRMDTMTGQVLDVSSLSGNGYHRLPDEIEDRNTVREVIYGGNINFHNDFMSAGLTAFKSDWDAALSPKLYPYNSFTFRGKENFNIGADFQFLFRNIYFFGEFARSQSGGIAWLGGFLANPGTGATVSVVYRDYQRNYQDLLSNAIGQNSLNSNERGLLINVSARLMPGLGISGYADIYRFPWLKYQTGFISSGSEYRAEVDFSTGKVRMYLRFRVRSKQIGEQVSPSLLCDAITQQALSARYQVDWPFGNSIHLSTRVEIVQNRIEKQHPGYGCLILQDITYKAKKLPLSLSFRYALFSTDSYNERIYSYEKDVLYGYSVPAYEGKGIRCFILAAWSPWRHLEFWLRYALTFYTDRDVVGSGLDQIDGNAKSELKIQARIML